MLKKLLGWFIIFCISLFIEALGIASQGQAFFCIKMAGTILISLIIVAIVLLAGLLTNEFLIANGISLILIWKILKTLAIILLVAWIASSIFNINFFIVYELLELGWCFINTDKND